MDILFSFIGSACVILLLYGLYWVPSKWWTSKRAYAECWWLPGWNCFRFVIRNMHSREDITSIEYRSWLRDRLPQRLGCSVPSLVDTELTSGKRVLLPVGDDLPVCCFRFEQSTEGPRFVHTDKLGQTVRSYVLSDKTDSLNIEYCLKVQRWFLFKHEIVRAFKIPRHSQIEGRELNVFDYLRDEQQKGEHKIRLAFKTAEVITVAV